MSNKHVPRSAAEAQAFEDFIVHYCDTLNTQWDEDDIEVFIMELNATTGVNRSPGAIETYLTTTRHLRTRLDSSLSFADLRYHLGRFVRKVRADRGLSLHEVSSPAFAVAAPH